MKSAHGVRRLACALVSMVAIGFTGCVSCTTPSFPSIGSSACSPCGCGGGGMLKGLFNRGGCGCGGGLGAAVAAVTPCGGNCGGDPCNSGGLLQNMCGNGCGPSGGLLGGGGACAQEMANQFGSMCEGGMCNRPYPPGMGQGGMPGAQVQYPYYTLRSPRDFLMANPPSIGP